MSSYTQASKQVHRPFSTTRAEPCKKRMKRVRVEVRLDVEVGEETKPATAVNLSPSGIGFTSVEPIELGARHPLILYLPEGKHEMMLLRLEARTVWQQPIDDGYAHGAAFEAFAPGDARRLKAWLLERMAPRA